MTIDTFPDRSATPLRPVIADSWQRSALSGLLPHHADLPAPVDIASADPLLDAARPVLDDAATRISGSEVSLLLVDHTCRIASRISAGTVIESALDSAGVCTGVQFAESSAGTNALGTPAEIRRGVIINGTEHYLDQFKSLSCYGHPIIHPATKRLVGSLCLTEMAERSNPLAVPFVNGVAADIADHLLDRSRAHQRRVLDAFQRSAPRRDVAVAVLGDDLQLTNSLAAELLSPTDIGALRALAADPVRHSTRLRLTLTTGMGVEVSIDPVPGTTGGAVFFLRPVLAAAPTTTRPQPRSVAAAAVITGEPGTGRTTRAIDLATELATTPRAPIVVDVAESLIDGTLPDMAEVLAWSRAENTSLVIDGAELLDDRSLVLLRHAVGRATTKAPIVVVTGPPSQAGAGAAALVGNCPRRIDLPPLRQRTADLVSIAAGIVAERAPGTTLSSGATEALLCQEWLGNFTELTSVLGAAVASCHERAARSIEVTDLPPHYRTSTRASRLAGREQAERQAIIDALERCGRNKVHAARDLGISRTTLYARMRALGV